MKASWEVAEALTLRAGERDLASAAPLATARVATTLVASRVRLVFRRGYTEAGFTKPSVGKTAFHNAA